MLNLPVSTAIVVVLSAFCGALIGMAIRREPFDGGQLFDFMCGAIVVIVSLLVASWIVHL